MTNYDIVVHTEAELKMINDMQSCLEQLESQTYRGKVMDILEFYHASKRVQPFIDEFNSFVGETACTCTTLDDAGDVDCMHPAGKFDMKRVVWSIFKDGHCLICGTYDLTDGICDHRALHDDCYKLATEYEPCLRDVNDGYRKNRLCQFLKWDKGKHRWEQRTLHYHGAMPECVMQREWRTTCEEAQVVLQRLKCKREEEVLRLKWLALAMGQHSRLGSNSPATGLYPEIIAMIMHQA